MKYGVDTNKQGLHSPLWTVYTPYSFKALNIEKCIHYQVGEMTRLKID